MRIAKWPMVSLVLVTVSPALVWADDDAKNVIEKAIKAHGGREILKKKTANAPSILLPRLKSLSRRWNSAAPWKSPVSLATKLTTSDMNSV
jgi:hypothetical protein